MAAALHQWMAALAIDGHGRRKLPSILIDGRRHPIHRSMTAAVDDSPSVLIDVKPSSNERGDEFIGGEVLLIDVEGLVWIVMEELWRGWIQTALCGACTCWGLGGRFNHRRPIDARQELRSLHP